VKKPPSIIVLLLVKRFLSPKNSGDKVFAGGKQIGKVIEMEVLFSVSKLALTQ
jgi:hypothetical protein